MTAKELAEMLSGRKYGMEITSEEARAAKDAGLVVVYGCSDDNVEFSGGIDEEVGAYEDTTIYITKNGLQEEPACNDAENCTCPYFEVAKNSAKTITAIWRDGERPSRVFSTDIPHETFTILEDGEPWCIGIVFSMAELGKQAEKPSSFIPGADVWVVERDEEGIACEVSGYMFLTEVSGFVIASSYINDLESIEDTLAYHAEETVESYDTDLAVFPIADAYTEQADAKSALEAERAQNE